MCTQHVRLKYVCQNTEHQKSIECNLIEFPINVPFQQDFYVRACKLFPPFLYRTGSITNKQITNIESIVRIHKMFIKAYAFVNPIDFIPH